MQRFAPSFPARPRMPLSNGDRTNASDREATLGQETCQSFSCGKTAPCFAFIVARVTDAKSLFQHTVAPDLGAGLFATRDGGSAILEPLTPQVSSWLQANGGGEATWLGEGLVIEMRYFADLADAIIAAGFHFERNELLSWGYCTMAKWAMSH